MRQNDWLLVAAAVVLLYWMHLHQQQQAIAASTDAGLDPFTGADLGD